MGLPQETTADVTQTTPGPSSTATPGTSTTQSSKPTVTSLPPEALELATRLFDQAREGQTESLSQYLQAGIPPNLTNHKGDTLLMLAAYHGHAATTKELLDRGADPNVLNDRGQSVIAGAVFKDHEEIVRMLHAKGADVRLGQPNAIEAARMFKKEGYLDLFGVGGEERGERPWEDARS